MVIYESKQIAVERFTKLFDDIKKTEHNSFFDFLIKQGFHEFMVEVKRIYIGKRGIASLIIQESQMISLLSQKNFLLYIQTDKGGAFFSAKQICNFAHLHYNKLNPMHRTVVIKFKYESNNLSMIPIQKCRNCLGVLNEFSIKKDEFNIKKNEKEEYKIEAVAVLPV